MDIEEKAVEQDHGQDPSQDPSPKSEAGGNSEKPSPKLSYKEIDVERIEAQAGYYSRNPEAYKKLQEIVAKRNPSADDAYTEAREARLELARERALRKYELDEDDLQLISGDSPEEIMSSASALRERYNLIMKKIEREARASHKATEDDDPSDDLPDHKAGEKPSQEALAAKFAREYRKQYRS